MRTIRLAFDLEDHGSFHEAVEESHGNRAIGQIVSPFVEVDIGHEGGRALLVSSGDDLVKQMSRLVTLGALDAVEPEFVDDEEIGARIAPAEAGSYRRGRRSDRRARPRRYDSRPGSRAGRPSAPEPE